MPKILGIDLGTTNCCLGYYEDNNFRIILSGNDQRLIQACVFYDPTNGSISVGELLNKQGLVKNLIFDVKRIIGRRFTDPFIQDNLKFWPFVTKSPSSDFCSFEVTVKKEKKLLKCEEVYSEILAHLKRTAEQRLQCEVKNVVITIPAYFGDLQRAATLEAAELAGFNVLRLINEPTAAALAYAHENNIETERLVLVYDLGGGTFDVSLVQFKRNCGGTVLQCEGEPQLGGRDFDNALMSYILRESEANQSMVVNKNAKNTARRLRSMCKNIKEDLSQSESYTLDLDEFFNQERSVTITREIFVGLIREHVDKTIECMAKMLKAAKVDPNEIDDVLLIGGSTRVPLVQDSVREFFKGKELLKAVNPDEAVAMGAALEAINCTSLKKEAHFINDITSVSFGIETGLNRTMSVVVEKGTKYPVEAKTCSYFTVFDFQEQVHLKVYQGEGEYVKDNVLLGEFSINQITPKLGGEVEILVTFGIDQNAILTVSAKERSPNSVDKELKIQLQK